MSSPRVRWPGLREAGWWMLVLAMSAYVLLSALTLANLGVMYDMPGGSPLIKLHPGTWLLALGLPVALAGLGHPIAAFWARVREVPLIGVNLAMMVLVAVWSVWRNGTSGAAFIVDSLWMPPLAVLLMGLYGQGRHRKLMVWLLALLGLNALLALGEFAVRETLVPRYPFQQELIADAGFFRASALLGHPLANSLITVALMPAALLLPARWRWPLLGLYLLALLAFGSRTALGAALFIYGTALALQVLWQVLHGRYSYVQVVGGLLAVLLVVTAVVGGVLASGLGERIFASLKWDNSANVRLVAWQALDHLDDFDWWIGIPPARIDEIAVRLGLDPRYEAIENFWVVLIMQFGLVGFVPFLIGLGAGLWHMIRVAAPPMRLAMPVFLFVASGANTLASKSVGLTLLYVVMLASAAWVPRPVPARGAAVPGRPPHARHKALRGIPA